MDLDELKKKITLNGLQYQQSLCRIIRKYSILYNEHEAIELNITNTDAKTLEHYMTLYEEQIKSKELESPLHLREDASLQLHNYSGTSQLDQTQQNGGNETRVSRQTFTDEDDDGMSNVRSQPSSLDSSLENFLEFEVPPEKQDEELELALRSQGSTLLELYTSMIDQIGRAQHRCRISEMGSSVLQKYRKWRLQSGRGNHNHRRITSQKETNNPESKCTSWPYPTSRDQTVLAMELSYIPESPKSKRINLNKTITVEKQLSFFAFSPSSASLGTSSDLSPNSRRFSVSAARMQPSACIPSPSRSSHSSSQAMLLTSRTLMGEQPSLCFLSPSRSSGPSSDQSLRSKRLLSGVAEEQPSSWIVSPLRPSGSSSDRSLISKRFFRSAAEEKASSCGLSPLRSSGPSSDQALISKKFFSPSPGAKASSCALSPLRSSGSSSDQPLISKRFFSPAAGRKASSCSLSPSRSSGPSLDHSPISKRLFSSAAGEQPPSRILSPSQFLGPALDQSLRSKRHFSAVARDQPTSGVLSTSRSPGLSLDQSLRSKRLAPAAAQEQQQPSLCVLSPSRSPGQSSDQSLRSKRLFNATAREQPSSGVLSPSRSPGALLAQSLRSKRLANAAAQEQKQPSSWVLSPSRNFGPSLEFSLRSKRLSLSAASADEHQQLSLWDLSPSRSSSQSSKCIFPTAGIAPESTEFKEQPDVYGVPVRLSPLKVRMAKMEVLRRSPRVFPRSPNSADVLGNSRSPARPLRRLLTPQTLRPKSSLDDKFAEHYHKFVCQSKHFNANPCRMCAGGAEARRWHHSSQTLAALALSPHCFKLGKRHRELERNSFSCSEPKRHRNETLRPRRDESPGSTSRGFRRRQLWQDSDQARGLPEESLLGSPEDENMFPSY
ncbi:uncharacterized protein LOC144026722 [Festucalex cinctus]